jgi:hypothetical protein
VTTPVFERPDRKFGFTRAAAPSLRLLTYVRRNLETAEEVQDLDCQGSVKLVFQMLVHPLEVTVKTVCNLSVHNRVSIGEAIPPIRRQCLEPGTGVV